MDNSLTIVDLYEQKAHKKSIDFSTEDHQRIGFLEIIITDNVHLPNRNAPIKLNEAFAFMSKRAPKDEEAAEWAKYLEAAKIAQDWYNNPKETKENYVLECLLLLCETAIGKPIAEKAHVCLAALKSYRLDKLVQAYEAASTLKPKPDAASMYDICDTIRAFDDPESADKLIDVQKKAARYLPKVNSSA